MKIEQNDSPLILSQTLVPDVFFTEYLPQSNGDYLKVYMYLYFLSKYNNDIKINDLSKKLALPLKIIQDAIKYWESVGLLIRKNQGFIITNLQDIELNKVYKPKISISPEHLKEVADNKNRAHAIETINNEFFQGVMSPSWYGDIDLWFKKYKFDEEVMIALFRYCFNNHALHRNYITTVADAWHKDNVKTFSELDSHFEKREKINTVANTIKKKLRLSRNLSEFEEAYVDKWVVSYKYDMNVIELALKKTTSKYNISFEYLDKLLTDWHKKDLHTPEQVAKYLENQKSVPKAKADTKNNKKSNYTQREYSDLNDFYINAEN